MYKNLYDNFAHWFHDGKGTVYFYSDPHFNDDEAKAFRKNYIGDDEQVKRINSKIGKYDTIVFLGDIGDIEFVRKIRGYKVLVMGNHDKGASNYRRKKWSFIYREEEYTKEQLFLEMKKDFPYYNISIQLQKYCFTSEDKIWRIEVDNGLFDEVYEGPLFIAPNILLSHERIDYPYAKNIAGHDHVHKYNGTINVCAEHIDYTPVSLKSLIERGLLKAPDIHRATIDAAKSKKNLK